MAVMTPWFDPRYSTRSDFAEAYPRVFWRNRCLRVPRNCNERSPKPGVSQGTGTKAQRPRIFTRQRCRQKSKPGKGFPGVINRAPHFLATINSPITTARKLFDNRPTAPLMRSDRVGE